MAKPYRTPRNNEKLTNLFDSIITEELNVQDDVPEVMPARFEVSVKLPSALDRKQQDKAPRRSINLRYLEQRTKISPLSTAESSVESHDSPCPFSNSIVKQLLSTDSTGSSDKPCEREVIKSRDFSIPVVRQTPRVLMTAPSHVNERVLVSSPVSRSFKSRNQRVMFQSEVK